MLSYTGNLVSNFSGGDKRTVQWMGLVDAGFQIDTDSALWWRGGTLNVEMIHTHGKGISATTLHDLQGICGIEAGNHPLLIWESWYHQQFGKFGIRGGFQNINSDFMVQPFTDDFSCGSYGTFPTLALNYSLPNYPVAGLGIALSYQFNQELAILSAVYNGRVANINDKTLDFNWRLNPSHDGILSVTELKHVSDSTHTLSRIGGLGVAFHNKRFASVRDNTHTYKHNYTVYAFGQHDFYRTSKRNAGVFLQGSYSVKNRNVGYGYSAIGMTASGFLSRDNTDVMGIGLSQLYYQDMVEGRVKNKIENTIEMFVKYQINRYLIVKPTFFTVISTSKTTVVAGMIELGLTIF